MTMLMPARVTCPNCKANFEINVVASANCFGTTTDFRPLSQGADPCYHTVHTCRTCGFTGNPSDFGTENVEPAVSEKISQHIRPRLQDERTDPATSWEFAALIAEWRNEDALAIAGKYQSAAWCAEATELESRYRRKAATWLERALDAGVPDRPMIVYLIGELYRRCGDKRLAGTWFDAAIREATAPEADWVKRLAIQQKTHPRKFLPRG